MGLGVVGLLWWKVAEGKTSETTQAAPAPSAAPTAEVFDEPPPPPPPPSAAPEPETKRAKAPTAKGSPSSAAPGSCSAECTGTASAALRSTLRAKAGAARGCYERALRNNPTLQGRMTVSVRVSSTGSVCSANVVENGLGDPSVTSCVVGMLRGSSLPAPTGGCIDAQIPMSFVSQQ